MGMGLADKALRAFRVALGLPANPSDPPDLMRLGLYPARVDKCADDGTTCDVTPSDKRISPEKNVEVLVGIPGATAVVEAGAIVLLGWRRGDPGSPYVMPAWTIGATVDKLILSASAVEIAGNAYKAILDTLLGDLKTALGYIPTAASTTYPGLVPNVVAWGEFLTALADGTTYLSTKVKHG